MKDADKLKGFRMKTLLVTIQMEEFRNLLTYSTHSITLFFRQNMILVVKQRKGETPLTLRCKKHTVVFVCFTAQSVLVLVSCC
jgi:hypothetical protein